MDDYDQIKTRVDRLKRDAAKAEGAYEQLLEQLSDFGCATIEEAQQELERMQEQERKEQATLNKLLSQFEKKWQEVLE